MASNFKILAHINDKNLHIKLIGDFDGSSACELLDCIGKHHSKFSNIFIHTNCLKRLYPFGLDVFRGNIHELSKKNPKVRIIFTGENANRFSL